MNGRSFRILAEILAFVLFAGLFYPGGSPVKVVSGLSGGIQEGIASTEQEHLKIFEEGLDYYYADNEMLIQTAAGASEQTVLSVAKAYDASAAGSIPEAGIYQLRFEEPRSLDSLMEMQKKIENDASVETAALNTVAPDQNDDEESDWAESARGWGFRDIGADQQEPYFPYMTDAIKIGIVDSGFQAHYDLNYSNTIASGEYNDNHAQHGTHVAGTACASWNGTGIKGVFPNASGTSSLQGKIWLGKTTAQKIEDLVRMITGGTKVINQSYGHDYSYSFMLYCVNKHLSGASRYANVEAWHPKEIEYFSREYEISIISNALERLIDAGYEFLIVQSAGNCSKRGVSNGLYCREYKDGEFSFRDIQRTGIIDPVIIYHNDRNTLIEKGLLHTQDMYYDGVIPSIYSNAFSAITDKKVKDRIIVVGSYGRGGKIASSCSFDDRVDIMAPGVAIYSTMNGGVGKKSGTSMAAPHVTGAIASIWSMNSDMTASEVKSLLLCGVSGATAQDAWWVHDGSEKIEIDRSQIRFITDTGWTDISKPKLNLAYSLELTRQYLGQKKTEEPEEPEETEKPEDNEETKEEKAPAEEKNPDNIVQIKVYGNDNGEWKETPTPFITVRNGNGNAVIDRESPGGTGGRILLSNTEPKLNYNETAYYISLPDGTYEVTIEAGGYKTITQPGMDPSVRDGDEPFAKWEFYLEKEKSEVDKNGILQELVNQYGVMPTGEKTWRVREGDQYYRPMPGQEFDGLLFADFFDYDGDGEEELLIMYNLTSEASAQAPATDELITLDMYKYHGGEWTQRDTLTITEQNIAYIGTNRRITFFRYSFGGRPAVGIDFYHEFNSMNETIMTITFNNNQFQVEGAVNYGEYPGSDEEHMVVSIPGEDVYIGDAVDRDGDGYSSWKILAASGGESMTGEIKESYDSNLAQIGLARLQYRSVYQPGADPSCRLAAQDAYKPLEGSMEVLGTLYADLIYENEELQKIDRIDGTGLLDVYR